MQRTNSNLKKSPNPSILLPKQLDILHECAVPIDQDFIFTLTKDIKEKIDKDARRTCKILKFTSNWDADDILAKIYKLDPKNFPNLFIFIIEVKNVDRFEASRITEKLIKFGKNRPIILQINSDDEVPVDDRKTKLLYKEENSNEFMDTKGKKVATTKNFYNFSTFLWLCMNEKQENLEKKVLKKLQKIKNSSLILKFLRVLKLSEQFFNDLVLKYAAQGLKSDFLITVDGFINDKGKFDFLDTKLITNTLIDYKSALFVAIQHSNKEVTDFIIKKCTILIQELPFEHQIEISEAALSTNQINVLCDLLTIADFPFPDDLKDLGLRKDPRLSRIIAERIKFHRSIMAENMAEITKFITENPNIKFAYNVKNKSALNQSQRSAKFETFFLLKSNRFRSNEIENFDENLDEDEFRSKARTLASVQRKENVDNSTPDKDKSVLLLATRSFIYNRGNENQVENIDVSKTQSTQGTTYPKSKWIFIGAKLTEDIKREQEIKGVIAHEICHLVMRLVFQNNEFPYSKDNIEASKKFDAIVNEIESMLFPPQEGKDTVDAAEDEEEEYFKSLIEELGIDNNKDNSDNSLVDDECDGIISSVYSSYGKSDYHVELIVRPVQIQTQFDDDPEKVAKLEEKYKNLFEFCIRVIIPELVKFNLKQRGNVENFNNFVGFSTEIRNLDIELRQTQDLASMMESKLVILSSNVPKLLKLNIYKFLFDKYGDLLEFQNIFIDPKCLENYFIRNNLKEILQEQKDLNIFVDCSNGFIDVSEFITSCEDSRIIVIASNDKCYTELRRKMKELKLDPQKLELNYSWTDLTKESQKKLLSTKINFQNNSDLSLYELIFGGFNETGQELADFADIVDDKLMNLLLEKSTIHLNIYPKENRNDLSFKILFQSRKLVKSFQNYNFVMPNNSIKIEIEKPGGTLARSILNTQYNNRQSILMLNEMIPPLSEETEPKYSKILPANIEVVDMFEELIQDEMLDDVKDMTHVLISDKAGSGKTWILKNLTSLLMEKYPEKWVTYVDLKQFIPAFKSKYPREFATFMVDKILNQKFKFEAKIFKKLYKSGKVFILFDGFDEIAPDCAEFVTRLIQSFQQNGGNQLWISTRDYFEVDLKEQLKLDAVYKLDEFTVDHGVDLIVKSWILNEMKDDLEGLTTQEVNRKIKKSKKFQKYKIIAEKLSEKFPESHPNSIGFPQFYKIISDVSVNCKSAVIKSTTFKLFEDYINIQYDRWTKDKGEIIMQESIQSQRKHLTFHKLHQLIAMESLFPEDSKFGDLDSEDKKDWSEQQIVACGFLSKNSDKIFFLQQTFREFYATDFMFSVLTKQGSKIDENLYGYLIKFLTIQKYVIIRMFLNEAMAEKSNFEKIEAKIPKISKNFGSKIEKLSNLELIFEENLENLVNFLQKVFKKGSYNKMCRIINKNSNIISASAKHEHLFIKITDFIIDYFKSADLRKFVADNQILITIFATKLDVKFIDEFIAKIEVKTDSKFISDVLHARNDKGENMLFNLIKSQHLNTQKLKETLTVLEKYLNDPKRFIKMLKECNSDHWNILHLSFHIKDVTKTTIIWTVLEQHFLNNPQFQEFIKQKTTKYSCNTLHFAACCQSLEVHEVIWKILSKVFANQEDLKDVIMQKNKYENNFICSLVTHNNADIIELTFKKLKELFNLKSYNEILTTNGNIGRNIIQIAVHASKDLKTHQFLWTFFKGFYKLDSIFLQYLKFDDTAGSNLFSIAAVGTTAEILEFMDNELSKIAKLDDIKLMLNKHNFPNKNLLQIAAQRNTSLDFHQVLWKIIYKYFDESEIISMISNTDNAGDNFFHFAVKYNNVKVVDFSWYQIRNSVEHLSDKFRFLKKNYEKNLLHYSHLNRLNPEVHNWCTRMVQKSDSRPSSCKTM